MDASTVPWLESDALPVEIRFAQLWLPNSYLLCNFFRSRLLGGTRQYHAANDSSGLQQLTSVPHTKREKASEFGGPSSKQRSKTKHSRSRHSCSCIHAYWTVRLHLLLHFYCSIAALCGPRSSFTFSLNGRGFDLAASATIGFGFDHAP